MDDHPKNHFNMKLTTRATTKNEKTVRRISISTGSMILGFRFKVASRPNIGRLLLRDIDEPCKNFNNVQTPRPVTELLLLSRCSRLRFSALLAFRQFLDYLAIGRAQINKGKHGQGDYADDHRENGRQDSEH